MGLSLLPTTDVQIIRVVEALYNQRPGYTILNNLQAYTTQNGLDVYANAVGGVFAGVTDAALAATVSTNFGLTGALHDVATSYLTTQFAANQQARGKVVLDTANLLSTLEGNATWGAAATAFNADVAASLAYSAVSTNTAITATSSAAADAAAAAAAATAAADAAAAAAAAPAAADAAAAAAAAQATADAAAAAAAAATAAADAAAAAAAATAAANVYTLTVADASITEGDTGTKTMTFNLALNQNTDVAHVVNYTMSAGTASADDVVLGSGTVSFANGQKNGSVSVTVNGDTDFEANETFTIAFTGANLAAAVSATGTITDNDSDPSLVAQTNALTTGVDAFTSLAGNDSFDASIAGSLDTSDVLDGGAGTDTLSATIGNESVRPTLSNIETIVLTGTADTLNFDARDVSGTTTYKSESSAGNISINNIGSVPTTVEINSSTADLTVNFADAALAGATDSLTLNVNNVTTAGGSSTIAFTDDGGTNTLETITLNSTSLDSIIDDLQTTAVGTATLNITGDTDLTITAALDDELTTVTGSAFTGDLTVGLGDNGTTITSGTGIANITAGGGADSITTGAEDDTINFATADFTLLDTVNAGAGTDSISMTDDATVVDADFTLVTNTETLTAAANINLDATLGALAMASGLTTVTLTDTGGADSITVGAGFTNALTINGTTGANSDVIDASAYTGNMTVTGTGAGLAAAANSYTMGSGTSVLNITATGATIAAADMANLEGFDTISYVTDVSNGSLELHDDNIAAAGSLTINATAITTATNTFTLDASAEVDGSLTVNGSAGIDDITGTASTLGDNISTGASADTIRFATANFTSLDTVNAGDGTDTISMTNDATVVDADFTLVSNTEVLTAAANINLDATLGALAMASGLTTVTLTDAGAADSITVGAGFTNALTVNLVSDAVAGNTVDATAYTGALTVSAADDELDSNASTITGGTGTSDTLSVTLTAGNDTILLTNVTAIENINTAGALGNVTMTTVDGNVAAGATLSIDATSMDDDVLTVDASAEADGVVEITADGTGAHDIILGQGNDTYTSTSSGVDTVVATAGNNTISTGAGADDITGGTGNDNITAGAGDDVITIATANFTLADTINGGADTDSILLSDDATVVDADFTLVTNTETLTAAANINLNATLGALAMASGLTTVTLTDTGAADSITVGAGFTSALSVGLVGDGTAGNTVDAAAYTGALTVTALASELNSNASTITGGTGTSDTLSVTVTAADEAILMTNVTAIENITTVGALGDVDITTVQANIINGATLTIDGTSLDGDALTVDASAETDGGVVDITADGTGAHVITLGTGNDTYTSTSSGIDTVVATAGNNTISTGAGADQITSGSGVDTLTSAAGANVLTLTSVALNATAVDIITDFTTATWDIDIDISAVGVVRDIKDASAAAGADDIALEVITGAFDLGTTTANDSVLVLNLAGNLASTDAVETALEFNGDLQLQTAGAYSVGDRFIVAYDDGSHSYIAEVAVGIGAADDTAFALGSLVATNLVQLTGITSVASITAANDIDFI